MFCSKKYNNVDFLRFPFQNILIFLRACLGSGWPKQVAPPLLVKYFTHQAFMNNLLSSS